MNLEKLTSDVRMAKAAGVLASITATDGGSANLDSAFLALAKGQRTAPVCAAIEAGGLSCSPSRWLGRGVMIAPPGFGQADKRYAANQAVVKDLRNAGWSVVPYCQMD